MSSRENHQTLAGEAASAAGSAPAQASGSAPAGGPSPVTPAGGPSPAAAPSTPRERVAKFDNAKFILIALVVVGHLLETRAFGLLPSTAAVTGNEPLALGSALAAASFVWIYAFHMPLFILISGLFLRPMHKQTPFPAFRVATLLMLGFTLKVVRSIAALIPGGRTGFALLRDSSTPWFLFALAAFFALAWLLREVNPWGVLMVAVGVGIFVGYDGAIGDELYLSRICVFFPFFWAGYLLDHRAVLEFSRKPLVRMVAAVIVLGFALASWRWLAQLFALKNLFSGRLPFAQTGIMLPGWSQRALAYGIQGVMSAAVLVLMPNRRMPAITRFGARSLSVYFWHFALTRVLVAMGIFAALVSMNALAGYFALVAVGIAGAGVLALKPFSVPLDWLTQRAVPGHAEPSFVTQRAVPGHATGDSVTP